MTVTIHPPQWSYHDVHGPTLADVAAHFAHVHEAGNTVWSPTYDVTSMHGHTIATAQVNVSFTVTMPQWPGRDMASDAEQAEWDRFVAALHAHEQGHIELATQYLQHADTLLEGHDQHTADHQWSVNLQNLNRASHDYDASTNHGQNDGTVINVP